MQAKSDHSTDSIALLRPFQQAILGDPIEKPHAESCQTREKQETPRC